MLAVVQVGRRDRYRVLRDSNPGGFGDPGTRLAIRSLNNSVEGK